jgi:hypothetical protein
VDGTEIQTSAALDPSDALAALAGLADCLSQPSHNELHYSVQSSARYNMLQRGNWNSSSIASNSLGHSPPHQQPQQQQQQISHHYQYHGSDERRADIIAHAFSNGVDRTNQPCGSVSNTYDAADDSQNTTVENCGALDDQKPPGLLRPPDLAPSYESTRIAVATTEVPTDSQSFGQAIYNHTDYRRTTNPEPSTAHQGTVSIQESATAPETPIAAAIENTPGEIQLLQPQLQPMGPSAHGAPVDFLVASSSDATRYALSIPSAHHPSSSQGSVFHQTQHNASLSGDSGAHISSFGGALDQPANLAEAVASEGVARLTAHEAHNRSRTQMTPAAPPSAES